MQFEQLNDRRMFAAVLDAPVDIVDAVSAEPGEDVLTGPLAPGARHHHSLAFSSVTPDFDADSDFDLDDLDLLCAEIAAATNNAAFDLNGDSLVDGNDLQLWLTQAGNSNIGAPYLHGDFNLDGCVDASDFVIWNANKFTSTTDYSAGDANCDGTVNGADFLIWNASAFTCAVADIPGVPTFDGAELEGPTVATPDEPVAPGPIPSTPAMGDDGAANPTQDTLPQRVPHLSTTVVRSPR